MFAAPPVRIEKRGQAVREIAVVRGYILIIKADEAEAFVADFLDGHRVGGKLACEHQHQESGDGRFTFGQREEEFPGERLSADGYVHAHDAQDRLAGLIGFVAFAFRFAAPGEGQIGQAAKEIVREQRVDFRAPARPLFRGDDARSVRAEQYVGQVPFLDRFQFYFLRIVLCERQAEQKPGCAAKRHDENRVCAPFAQCKKRGGKQADALPVDGFNAQFGAAENDEVQNRKPGG